MAARDILRLPVPPHSVEAEQGVLGSVLLDSAHAWPAIEGKIAAADFHRPDHRLIFGALEQLGRERRAADLVTVDELLERREELAGAGGYAYLATLARETPSAGNVEHYAQIVREHSVRRQLAEIGARIERSIQEGGDRAATEILAEAQRALLDLQGRSRVGAGLVSSRELAGQFLDDLDARREKSQGLQIGLADFDELTGGLEGGDLVVIASRPGMGKTALLVTIAAHTARSHPVAVFSAEMPARQLMRRAVAMVSGIDQRDLKRPGELEVSDWEAISHGAAELAARTLWIDDTALPQLTHIRSECMALKARAGLGLVLIDYVQLVQERGANRYEQLREVAYGLKALAKNLAVPVIVLAQLNRAVESRDKKRAYLSDLRDSGAIEEAADIVGLLYSEGYYDPAFGMPYVLECRIEKHRNGERAECLWHFSGKYSRVSVLEDGPRAQYKQLRIKQQRRGGLSDDL
ncbi:MAG: replicative DNA helicase [Steroidobacteraceae bacterium]